MMGTRHTLEYTAQVSQTGPTHMGTVRRTRRIHRAPGRDKIAPDRGGVFLLEREQQGQQDQGETEQDMRLDLGNNMSKKKALRQSALVW